MVVDLSWVDFDFRVPPSGQAAKPHLPKSYQPGRSLADRGILKIQSTQPKSPTTWDALEGRILQSRVSLEEPLDVPPPSGGGQIPHEEADGPVGK